LVAVEAVAERHYRFGKQLTAAATARLTALWDSVDRSRVGESWASLVPVAVSMLATAQQTAAADAQQYMVAAMLAQDIDPAGPVLRPEAFAATASDGRPLESLLMSPVFTALGGIRAGMGEARSMGAGLSRLLLTGQTQIADASRTAGGAVIASRKVETGYVRMLNPPSCSRCAILAGRWYRWNKGFSRHPGCDCRHIPSTENQASDLTTDPYEYFNSLDAEEQARIFTKAGAQAIKDGSDIFQVVNARRGMATTAGGSKVTNEGVTRRGYWGSQQETRDRRGDERVGRATRQRMMPEEIYKRAKTREDAIRLLKDHGYITDQGQIPTGAIFGAGKGTLAGRYQ
jgi:hypothetical protein